MATSLKLNVDQGTDFVQILKIKDSLGAPINVTGYTFRGSARASMASPDVAITFTFVIRNQSTNTGEVEWVIPNTTSSLDNTQATQYVYDVEMVDTGSRVTRLVQGQITLYPEVTRP